MVAVRGAALDARVGNALTRLLTNEALPQVVADN